MDVFKFLWATATEVTYNPAWANNTGYFDHVVKEAWNEPVKFKDEHGRRVVVLPFETITIVMNDRYSKSDSPTVINTYNK